MGGMPLASNVLGSAIDNTLLNQAAMNIQTNMAAAMANQQAALNQYQSYQRATDPLAYERAMQASALNRGVRGVDTRTVSSTAASRVQKAAWEQEEDRKDREVDEMIRRHKEVLQRIDAEEGIVKEPANKP